MNFLFKIHIIICIVCAAIISNAQTKPKLAIINDKDGFTNVRSGKSINYGIVAKLEKDDFFYCDWTDSEWIKISALKWLANGNMVEGYIRRSKIQLLDQLDNNSQRSLIANVFLKEKEIFSEIQKSCKSEMNIACQNTYEKLREFNDEKYSPTLELFSIYFCTTKDTSLLVEFFNLCWANQGSADEMPSFVSGDCFVCHPKLILEALRQLRNSGERDLIYNKIDWGLQNHFYSKKDTDVENNPDYIKYEKILGELK